MGLRGRLPPPPPPGPPPHPQLLSWILVLLVILLVGVVVYFAVGYASRPVPAAPAAAPASRQDLLALVALRYANGDITRDEFQRMTADLGGAPVAAAEQPPPDAIGET